MAVTMKNAIFLMLCHVAPTRAVHKSNISSEGSTFLWKQDL
jgi:hypothetical protein